MPPRAGNGEHPVYDAHVLPEYTVELDINGKYLDVSDDFCKVLGYSRKELIGKRFDSITAPGTITHLSCSSFFYEADICMEFGFS